MSRYCAAVLGAVPTDYPMTDPTPLLPVLQRMNHESSMFQQLSAFQQSAAHLQPTTPRLVEVLAAALPAFELGFSYTASHWNGELTVTLHYQGAELGSSAKAALDNYSETCARLLAGLLGIPVLDADEASEPEVCASLPQSEEPSADSVAPEPAADPEEADEEFDDGLDQAPAGKQPAAPDNQRELTDEEKATAIGMIKVMEPSARKAFTKAFRELFQVPADAKQISPFITKLEHWLFIDRYTVEASGGIAA